MEIKIEKMDYSYNYLTKKSKKVFNNLNMIFESGKITAIIGESGSGKSTLLELLIGNLEPTKGKIIKPDLVMGLVHKNNELIFNSVKRELKINGKDFSVLKKIGLNEKILTKKTNQLSYSEKKLVMLASVLISNPKILLLDEISLGLDRLKQEKIISLLRNLKKDRIIIVTSRDVNFINQIADYVYILENKKIVLKGNKNDVFKNYRIKPDIVSFIELVNKEKRILEDRDNTKDLMKDIYRSVTK